MLIVDTLWHSDFCFKSVGLVLKVHTHSLSKSVVLKKNGVNSEPEKRFVICFTTTMRPSKAQVIGNLSKMPTTSIWVN
eukprot:SAG22_NODE_173_length_16589_cov_120.738933_18_plen_78_part_00